MNCLNCDKIIQETIPLARLFSCYSLPPEPLCRSCRQLIASQRINTTKSCPICRNFGEETVCSECLAWRKRYGQDYQHHSCFYYNDFFSEWLERFKRQGDYILGQLFTKEIRQSIQIIQPDIVVPIPSSAIHLEARGFNQVAVMLEFAGIPYQCLLELTVSSGPQSQKTRQERLESKIAFEVRENVGQHLSECSILLVDDVYTTGATLHQAAYILAPYAKQIETFSLCR